MVAVLAAIGFSVGVLVVVVRCALGFCTAYHDARARGRAADRVLVGARTSGRRPAADDRPATDHRVASVDRRPTDPRVATADRNTTDDERTAGDPGGSGRIRVRRAGQPART